MLSDQPGAGSWHLHKKKALRYARAQRVFYEKVLRFVLDIITYP
jgi:hypothetical protein